MGSLQSQSSHTAPERPLTAADLAAYEQRYNLRHRFFTPPGDRRSLEHTVIDGRVDERQPQPGFQIVGSDLTVYHTYEAHARPDAPAHISIIVLVEGCAELELGDERHSIAAGDGVLLAYGGREPLCARHVAQPRVRAVNVTVTATAMARDPRLAALLPLVENPAGIVPIGLTPGLWQSLSDWLHGPPDATDLLLAEGLALQLLAQGAAHAPTAPAPSGSAALSDRDQQLLLQVRARLESQPARAHRLTELAALACMSPSSLRDKFRLAYGRSVFDYLREVRLAQARQCLRNGQSVQQAASQAGYRHPTNFATAFRKRFGISPSDVRCQV